MNPQCVYFFIPDIYYHNIQLYTSDFSLYIKEKVHLSHRFEGAPFGILVLNNHL